MSGGWWLLQRWVGRVEGGWRTEDGWDDEKKIENMFFSVSSLFTLFVCLIRLTTTTESLNRL